MVVVAIAGVAVLTTPRTTAVVVVSAVTTAILLLSPVVGITSIVRRKF